MENTSYAEVSAQLVLEACMFYRNRREETIKKMQEKHIDAEMSRRFFRPKSREEARAKLELGGLSSDWGMIELHFGFDAGRVRKLESLANTGADKINLCSEDAHILRDFFGFK